MKQLASRFIYLLPALMVLVFSACSSFPSVNQDPARNNKEAFRKDLAECKEDHPESAAGIHFKRWSDCMKLKGWQ